MREKILKKERAVMKRLTGIILGAILIACGVVYILDSFGITDINFSFDGWWALFIIIPSLRGCFENKDKAGSVIGLIVGILLLLAAQDVIEYDMIWKIIVPLIIIILGIKLIVKSTSPKKNDEYAEKGEDEAMAAFSSQSFDYADEEITVAKIGAVFGGAKCNLTDAKIEDGSQLNLFCAFGGADIIVPENVNIKVNAFCLFGGISDKRVIKAADTNNVTLTINGFCIFGGADIK